MHPLHTAPGVVHCIQQLSATAIYIYTGNTCVCVVHCESQRTVSKVKRHHQKWNIIASFSLKYPKFVVLRSFRKSQNESPSRGTRSPYLLLRRFSNLRLIYFATLCQHITAAIFIYAGNICVCVLHCESHCIQRLPTVCCDRVAEPLTMHEVAGYFPQKSNSL